MFSAGTSSISGGDDGFFSRIGDTVANTADQLLPIWAAQQLRLQSTSTLAKPTFDASAAPPRIDDKLQTTIGTAQTGAPKAGIPSFVWFVLAGIGATLLAAALLRRG